MTVGDPHPDSRLAVLAALDGYRNVDGGYGWGIEPDLRAAESQPAGALHALEAIADAEPETADTTRRLMDRLGRVTLDDGGLPVALPVAGGAEGESLRPLDFAPTPGRPVRTLLDEAAVARDLDRLENGQQADGGWAVDFDSYSEAARVEWRGYATVSAVSILLANGRCAIIREGGAAYVS